MKQENDEQIKLVHDADGRALTAYNPKTKIYDYLHKVVSYTQLAEVMKLCDECQADIFIEYFYSNGDNNGAFRIRSIYIEGGIV